MVTAGQLAGRFPASAGQVEDCVMLGGIGGWVWVGVVGLSGWVWLRFSSTTTRWFCVGTFCFQRLLGI
jgi:hypothetical protein